MIQAPDRRPAATTATADLTAATSPSRSAPRLLLADDHRTLRQGLRRSLTDMGFDVVGEAGDGREAVALTARLSPDIVLMDVSMPGVDGVEAARLIHRSMPSVAVVMLTMHADGDVMAKALKAGAIGYLVKDASIDEVADALHLAASGEAVVSPALASSMLAEMSRSGDAEAGADTVAETVVEAVTVSAREEEVLQLFADGLSLPEVAAELFISVKTVKNHLASAYAKLDARDRTQAVLRAVRMGIIRLE